VRWQPLDYYYSRVHFDYFFYTTTMEYLPKDILNEICSLLLVPDLLRLLQCSKKLLAFIEDHGTFFSILDFSKMNNDKYVKNLTNKYGKHIISISSLVTMTDFGLKCVGEGCSNLLYLSLLNCVQITYFGIRHLSVGCRNIQTLFLDNCCLLTNSGLNYLAEGCPNIQLLSLKKLLLRH